MNLLQKLTYKLKYFWHTRGVKDNETTVIEVPYASESGEELSEIINVPGSVYKVFIHVILNLELDPRWDDEHIAALAGFMLACPDEINETTLLAFLHPEFYEDFEVDVELDEEQE